MRADAFAPYAALAEFLLPHAAPDNDGAHDIGHLQRVWRNAKAIHAVEGGDGEVLLAATLLHDCVNFEKTSPHRARASTFAAEKAGFILAQYGWGSGRIGQVAHAVRAHSYSAMIAPETLEAKILQDADRLDALGMIGIARCFYVAGQLGTSLYDPVDPEAKRRLPEETRYAVDHICTRLLGLAEGFHTPTGSRLACEREWRLQYFTDSFFEEIGCPNPLAARRAAAEDAAVLQFNPRRRGATSSPAEQMGVA